MVFGESDDDDDGDDDEGALPEQKGKSTLAPNLSDVVQRGENVRITQDGTERIARIEDMAPWSEIDSDKLPADAGVEWRNDCFLLVRFYERRKEHSFSRKDYPHLDRAIEVELESRDNKMVWLPAMNVVGVAFIAHAEVANAMVLGLPFDAPLANAFVITRETNGNPLPAEAVAFFPEDGPYKFSRYGMRATRGSLTKREWFAMCGCRELVIKLMSCNLTVGKRDGTAVDVGTIHIDVGAAHALYDLLSGVKKKRDDTKSCCFFRPSDKLFVSSMVETGNWYIDIFEREDLRKVAYALGLGWNISCNTRLLPKANAGCGAALWEGATVEVVAPAEMLAEMLAPAAEDADDDSDDDSDDADDDDAEDASPLRGTRLRKRPCRQKKPRPNQLAWVGMYFDDNGLTYRVMDVRWAKETYSHDDSDVTYDGVAVYYDRFSTLCGKPITSRSSTYDDWSKASDFAREFKVRKAAKAGCRVMAPRLPGLKFRFETTDEGPICKLHITVRWARVPAKDVGWPQSDKLLLL
jgi:hypothetical protein